MRTFWRVLIAILLLAWIAAPSLSADPQERIEQLCREYVLGQLQWVPEDLAIQFRRYIKPAIDWSKVTFKVSHPRNADLCGVVTLRVKAVRDGKVIRSFPVPIQVTLYDEVVVTTRKLRRYTAITSRDVALERREVTLRAGSPLTDPQEVIGRRTVRTLQAGRPLDLSVVEEIPLVRRGERVTVRYQTENLLLTALGEAIEDGWKGRPVRVKNLSSKKLITGVVADDGLVDVWRASPGK